MRVSRFGQAIRKPLYCLPEYTGNATFSTFLQTFPQQHTREKVMPLLQPDIEGQSEPHTTALMSDHIFAFIGSDPYNMYL